MKKFSVLQREMRQSIKAGYMAAYYNPKQRVDYTTPLSILCHEELVYAVQKAISKLPEEQKKALKLNIYSTLTTAEAADKLACSKTAFRFRVNAAKKRLAYSLRKFWYP
jgi:DNA-directed RNA polymerase specialized sigma24 family protein